MIEDDRILIQMDDGSNAVEIRDFLVQQEDCYEVTVDSQTYDGKAKLVCLIVSFRTFIINFLKSES